MLRRIIWSLVTRTSLVKKMDFIPPEKVRGMKKLNRDMFDKIIIVPCLMAKSENLHEIIAIIKKYFLKLQCFKPIQGNEDKMLYLDPIKIKSFQDFDAITKKSLQSIGIDTIMTTELTIKYENWKADEILRAITPPEIDSVSGYSLIGHIVHLNLKPELYDYRNLIGQVLLDKIKNARTVITKSETIENEFRNFKFEVLAGDDDLNAKVKENGCNFEMDFSSVYWNPRLSTEHERIVKLLKKDDVLFDIFAGVGPFSVPAGKKHVKVFANDLNPHSFKWLKYNLVLNKVKNVEVFNKDGADFIKEIFKEKLLELPKGDYKIIITMNLPSLAPKFLSNFRSLYTQDKRNFLLSIPVPEAFVYCFIKNSDNGEEAAKQLVANELGYDTVKEVFYVRKVAPNKDMFRVIVRLTPDVLLSSKRSLSPKD